MTARAPGADTAVERADVAASDAATSARNHPLVRAGEVLSKLADQPPLLGLSATVIAAGLLGGDARLTRAGGRMLAAELTCTLMKAAVKHVVERARPFALVDDGEYRFGPGDRDESRYNSFPSGHTAGVVAVTRAAAREYAAFALPGLTLSAAVAGVQVPAAKHYPSDVAAGWAIGWAAEWLVHRLGRRLA